MKIIKTIPIKYHVLFWITYFALNFVRWGNYYDDFQHSLASNLVEFPIHILLVYINIYFLIPRIVLKRKYKFYILILSALLIAAYFTRVGLNYFFVTSELWPEARSIPNPSKVNHFIAEIIGEIYVITFVTAIKLLVDWLIEKRKNEKLAKLQLSTELKFLRTQIQPHFFFNALNNLYALTLEKSDNAPQLVIKISEMMEYVLYEVKSSKADLLQEISHINNFIDIARLRFGDSIDLDLSITGDIENVKVPPLLFLSFVENCLKHGMKENEKLKIEMSFEIIDKRYLEFKLSNNFNPKASQGETKGIGISNTKRRLNLLFSNDFVLETKNEEDIYMLYLKIPLL